MWRRGPEFGNGMWGRRKPGAGRSTRGPGDCGGAWTRRATRRWIDGTGTPAGPPRQVSGKKARMRAGRPPVSSKAQSEAWGLARWGLARPARRALDARRCRFPAARLLRQQIRARTVAGAQCLGRGPEPSETPAPRSQRIGGYRQKFRLALDSENRKG